jgi:AraC-like DNA-binding protein
MDNPYNEMQARRGLYQALWSLNPDSARIELEAFNQLKDSLYNNASAETLARYNAEFGVDELQEENTSVRRSRIYIVIIGAILLLVAIALVIRQRKLTALQRKRLGEVSMTLDELRQRYENLTATDENGHPYDVLSEQDKDFLTKTMSIITEQLEENRVNVDELASSLAMSTSQFRRRLSALTGETPQSYITNIRMQKARHLLDTHPELTVWEVALQCGYDDQSSFTRAFRRFFGITPSEYQQSNN